MLERVFESLLRATTPTGLGLGLSSCRSINEAHGGRLSASAKQRQGATFQVPFPTRQIFYPDCKAALPSS